MRSWWNNFSCMPRERGKKNRNQPYPSSSSNHKRKGSRGDPPEKPLESTPFVASRQSTSPIESTYQNPATSQTYAHPHDFNATSQTSYTSYSQLALDILIQIHL
jgi:hypothetical protein